MPRDTLISVNKVGNESFLMVTKVFVPFQSSNCLAEKEGELVALRKLCSVDQSLSDLNKNQIIKGDRKSQKDIYASGIRPRRYPETS